MSALFLHDSVFDGRLVIAPATAEGSDPQAVQDLRAYTEWLASESEATLTVDTGEESPADYLAIWSHNLYTAGATVTVRKSTDGFAVNDVAVAEAVPDTDFHSDMPLLIRFGQTSSRYWRVSFAGAAPARCAIVLLGRVLEFPTPPEQPVDPLGEQVHSHINHSRAGWPLGTTIAWEQRSHSLTFRNLSWSWVRDTFMPAWRAHLRMRPFLYAWSPALFPAEIELVTAGPNLSIPHESGSLAHLSLSIEAAIPEAGQ